MTKNVKKTARRRRLLKGFAKRLRAAREVSGYEEQKDFAADLGMHRSAYGKYERGESFPMVETLEDILWLTNTSADWIIFGRRQPAKAE